MSKLCAHAFGMCTKLLTLRYLLIYLFISYLFLRTSKNHFQISVGALC